MTRYSLDELIELAARAAEADAVAEIAPAESKVVAPIGAHSDCLTMSRLALVQRAAVRLSPAEASHVAACAVCAARSRAFALRAQSQLARSAASSWHIRLLRAAPFAAAAALAFLMIQQPQDSRSGVGNGANRPGNGRVVIQHGDPRSHADLVVSRALPVSLRYAPHGVGAAAGARVDCFQSTAHEACTVLALFRTWNSACQCLMWELHQWEDGATLAEMAQGESVDLPLDVAGSPPVQQLLVLAVARERRDLPGRPADTDALLECLNHTAPPLGPSEDAAAYTSAVSSCLPSGVTVVPAAFVPR